MTQSVCANNGQYEGVQCFATGPCMHMTQILSISLKYRKQENLWVVLVNC